MSFENPSREEIKKILETYRTVAVVGCSDKPDRTSHMVTKAMQARGYHIIPVNPQVEGSILGEVCYPSLLDIKQDVGIVNVFRRSEYCEDVAQGAVAIGAKVLWLQQGVWNEQAANIAQAAGITVIMDRCIKVEDALLLR